MAGLGCGPQPESRVVAQMLWTPKLLWASLTNAATALFCGFQSDFSTAFHWMGRKRRIGMRVLAQAAIYLRPAGAELFKSVYFIRLNNWQK